MKKIIILAAAVLVASTCCAKQITLTFDDVIAGANASSKLKNAVMDKKDALKAITIKVKDDESRGLLIDKITQKISKTLGMEVSVLGIDDYPKSGGYQPIFSVLWNTNQNIGLDVLGVNDKDELVVFASDL